MTDSFKARTTLEVGQRSYDICGLGALEAKNIHRLPFSLKILLENLLRFEDGVNVKKSDIEALLSWDPKAVPHHRRAMHRGPRRHARSHRAPRRRSAAGESARPR
jgi:aconitate hydratase